MAHSTVAIVMSNYNHARYLHQSLQGICEQTRPADQIIVVDDCSTDDSLQIMMGYAAKNPLMRVLQNEARLGVQESIARALSLVTADYLIWTAADDCLLPRLLEESMAALERYPHAGLCFSETTELRGENEVFGFATEPTVSHIFNLNDLPEYLAPPDLFARMKRAYLPIAANTVVVRREALVELGGYVRKLEWHADSFAYISIAMRYGACVIPRTLALIRATPQSYSTAMHDPARQAPVLRAMLDLLATREFRDIRASFRRCPSNFSPWLNLMLKVQLEKVRDWDLLLPYLFWKIQELKRGHRMSWAGTIYHILYRSLAPRLGSRLFPKLTAERNQLMQRIGDVTAERDGAANALITARRDLDAIREQRDRLANELQQVRSEAVAQYDAILAQRNAIGNELERTRREAAWMANRYDGVLSQYKETLAQRDAVANELAKARQWMGEQSGDTGKTAGSDATESGRWPAKERQWIPPMLVTTMPKSGTYYLAKLLSLGLSIDNRIVSHQYFPEDVIRQPELRILSMGNCVSQDHFGASRINLTHIVRHVDRMLVHMRDPRQALLSYVHYLDTDRFRRKEDETHLFIYPPLPADFYARTLSSRLDWAIESWLPHLIAWVQEWVRADNEEKGIRIKFTHYEDLVTDRAAFVADLLRFFDIPESSFLMPDIEPDSEIHFRRGETDEWKMVFTAEQIAASNAIIPGDLAKRFGWIL